MQRSRGSSPSLLSCSYGVDGPDVDIQTVTYHLLSGKWVRVTYDADAPCWLCGLPVGAASTSGTVVCSWCDAGEPRNNEPPGTIEKRWALNNLCALLGARHDGFQGTYEEYDEEP